MLGIKQGLNPTGVHPRIRINVVLERRPIVQVSHVQRIWVPSSRDATHVLTRESTKLFKFDQSWKDFWWDGVGGLVTTDHHYGCPKFWSYVDQIEIGGKSRCGEDLGGRRDANLIYLEYLQTGEGGVTLGEMGALLEVLDSGKSTIVTSGATCHFVLAPVGHFPGHRSNWQLSCRNLAREKTKLP